MLVDYGIETYELDFKVGKDYGRHHLLAGARHRKNELSVRTGDLPPVYTATLGSASRPLFTTSSEVESEEINSAFIENTLTLREDVKLLVGTKFEENEVAENWMPTARAWWTVNEKSTAWASYSIAYQNPAYNSRYYTATLGYAPIPPAFTTFVPLGTDANPDSQPSKLKQWEAGWRQVWNDHLSVDATAFYGEFEGLTLLGSHGFGGNHHNADSADTYGGEIAMNWTNMDTLRLRMSASYSDTVIEGPGASTLQYSKAKWRGNLQADYTPAGNLAYHLGLYGSERAFDKVPGYIRTDLGISWKDLGKDWEASVRVQNLFDPSHPEDFSELYGAEPREIPRTVYLKLRRWF